MPRSSHVLSSTLEAEKRAQSWFDTGWDGLAASQDCESAPSLCGSPLACLTAMSATRLGLSSHVGPPRLCMKVCFEHSIFSTGVYLTLPDITLGYPLTDMREVAKYGLVFKYLQGTRTFSLAPVKPLLLLVCACLSEFIKVYCVFPCLDVYRQVRADETVLDPGHRLRLLSRLIVQYNITPWLGRRTASIAMIW